ncbi:NAD-dependent epimerase/dehydratase family protein [Jiangella ureilytica]|uniref:NAD-dependent epimerase/dehydratase family protein n=1 Tax=Jiangella ureilytica TaxID=2530374 RepID=A0A4R4RN26_9ACTN|nr:NAD(P)H-binding protein [Jiangella ureilytica]TDC50844.1 NAD-dependent epimerase/dehydratase family protein [Jiangella ureilytica]
MTTIAVFGAGGRAGRAVLAEAAARGWTVTAVVRDPARHPDLGDHGGSVRLVAGDVTDADAVATLSAGHDAAVHAAADLGVPAARFFPAAATALLSGLTTAGVRRLVAVGLASQLPDVTGTPLIDTPGYPSEHREFMIGHGAGLDVFRTALTSLDWLVIAPAGDFDHGGPRIGRYRFVPGDAASRISYADLAVAVADELERPRHHRLALGVEGAG